MRSDVLSIRRGKQRRDREERLGAKAARPLLAIPYQAWCQVSTRPSASMSRPHRTTSKLVGLHLALPAVQQQEPPSSNRSWCARLPPERGQRASKQRARSQLLCPETRQPFWLQAAAASGLHLLHQAAAACSPACSQLQPAAAAAAKLGLFVRAGARVDAQAAHDFELLLLHAHCPRSSSPCRRSCSLLERAARLHAPALPPRARQASRPGEACTNPAPPPAQRGALELLRFKHGIQRYTVARTTHVAPVAREASLAISSSRSRFVAAAIPAAAATGAAAVLGLRCDVPPCPAAAAAVRRLVATAAGSFQD
jgi:hypothetical protein